MWKIIFYEILTAITNLHNIINIKNLFENLKNSEIKLKKIKISKDQFNILFLYLTWTRVLMIYDIS